jgi:hypothetical protein
VGGAALADPDGEGPDVASTAESTDDTADDGSVDSGDDDGDDDDEDETEGRPEAPGGTRPLAIPGPEGQPRNPTRRDGGPGDPRAGDRRRGDTPVPDYQDDSDIPPPTFEVTKYGHSTQKERPPRYVHLDAGYRLSWFGTPRAPVRIGSDGRRDAHLLQAAGGVMLPNNLYLGGSFETVINRLPGTFPLVGELRVGWWDNALGAPTERGPFKMLAGTAITYAGIRWVHDHYQGTGGEWAGTADAGGLVLGYTRAAPFGPFTVITESQFTLYLVGWKGRSEFPLGLLNQRLSLGWEPLFLDLRFKADPATGEELSIGASIQTLF